MEREVANVENAAYLPRSVTKQQEAWLESFARDGGFMRSCKASGVGHDTVYVWLAEPAFKARHGVALQQYRESLEKVALLDRLKDPKCAPLLVIFALKAAWREKYGDDVKAVDTAAGELLKKLESMPGGSSHVAGARMVRDEAGLNGRSSG